MKMIRLPIVALFLIAPVAHAGITPDFMDWTSPTAGSLDGIAVIASGFTGGALTSDDLSGEDYNYNGSSNQELISYDVASDWTLEFAEPVKNLQIYTRWWRGPGLTGGVAGDYTFNQTPTIASGLPTVLVDGNKVTFPASPWQNGIIDFGNTPISTLTMNSSQTDVSSIGMTFATEAIPEPGMLALMGLSAGGIIAVRRIFSL